MSRLLRPSDSWLDDSHAVQLKGYRTKQEYFTVAVFENAELAQEFADSFPSFPAGSIRILNGWGEVIYRKRFSFVKSKHVVGSTAWWLDQSKDMRHRITRKSVELPRFSVINIARKSLRSFVK
jgi:hypothetical protein